MTEISYLVTAKHPTNDRYSIIDGVFRTQQYAGTDDLYYAYHPTLGCSKNYRSREEAISKMCRDHALRIVGDIKAIPEGGE